MAPRFSHHNIDTLGTWSPKYTDEHSSKKTYKNCININTYGPSIQDLVEVQKVTLSSSDEKNTANGANIQWCSILILNYENIPTFINQGKQLN